MTDLDLRPPSDDRAVVADADHRPPPTPPSPSDTATLATPKSKNRRVQAVIAAVVLAAVFGIALPLLADYGDAWGAITSLNRLWVAAIALATVWNLYTYWPVLTAALPGLRTREAMVVQQASTAVANTVPAGGAVGMAVTVRFLRSWGFTTHAITGQLVAVNVASLLVKLSMPVVALTLLAATGQATGASLWLAAVGVGVAVSLLAASATALRDQATTRRAGDAIDRLIQRARWRSDPTDTPVPMIGPWLTRLRDRLVSLARNHGARLLTVTVVSHTSLFAVLLVTLRAVGVGADDVGWPVVFAAFAFVRLLSAVPVTPGGSGIVELGYVGLLISEAPDGLESRIAAAVLLFRAVTFLLPIALGAAAWVVFHSAASWRHQQDSRGALEPA